MITVPTPSVPDVTLDIPKEFPPGPRVLCNAADLKRVHAWKGKVPWIDLSIERLLKNAESPLSLPEDAKPSQVAAKMIYLVERNALAHLLIGEAAHLERALSLFEKLCKIYGDMQAGPPEGRMSREGLRESSLGIEVARAYDLLRVAGLKESEEAPIRAMLTEWYKSLKRQGHRTCGNHHTWGLSAMLAIGSALGDRTMVHEVFHGYDCGTGPLDVDVPDRAYGLIHQLRHDFFDDGCHWERTVGYHMYTLMAFNQIAMNASNLGIDLWNQAFPALTSSEGFDLHRGYESRGPRVLKMMYESTLYRAMVNGDMSVLHDSGLVNLRGLGIWGIVYEAAFDAYADPRFAWVLRLMEREHPTREFPGLRMSLQTVRGDMDFVRIRTDELPKGECPFPSDAAIGGSGRHVNGCTLLPVAGEAILRSDPHDANAPGAFLCFGPHNAGHQSPGALHLEIFNSGRAVTVAPRSGHGGYDNSLHATWIRSTLAHNTVTVDQRPMFPYDFANPSIWEADHWRGRVSDGVLCWFEAGRGYSTVRASNQNVYPGVLLDRTLVLTREWLLDVYRVVSDQTHHYDLAIHGVGELNFDYQAQAYDRPEWKEAAGYRQLLKPRKLALPGTEAELTWNDGRGSTTVQVLLPNGGQAFVADVHDAVHEIGDGAKDSLRRTSAILSFAGTSGLYVSLWRFGATSARVTQITPREMKSLEIQIDTGSGSERWRCPFQKEPVRRIGS